MESLVRGVAAAVAGLCCVLGHVPSPGYSPGVAAQGTAPCLTPARCHRELRALCWHSWAPARAKTQPTVLLLCFPVLLGETLTPSSVNQNSRV